MSSHYVSHERSRCLVGEEGAPGGCESCSIFAGFAGWLALCDGDATIWNIPRGDLDFVMNVILRTPNNVDRIRKTNI